MFEGNPSPPSPLPPPSLSPLTPPVETLHVYVDTPLCSKYQGINFWKQSLILEINSSSNITEHIPKCWTKIIYSLSLLASEEGGNTSRRRSMSLVVSSIPAVHVCSVFDLVTVAVAKNVTSYVEVRFNHLVHSWTLCSVHANTICYYGDTFFGCMS